MVAAPDLASVNVRFAVLEAGPVAPDDCQPAEASQRYCNYTALYKRIFGTSDGCEEWHQYRCYADEFPKDSDLDMYQGFVISGSRHDAHSDLEFIVRLRALVVTLHNRQRSNLVGVCFGHQLIAHALGGLSGRALEIGWQIGIQSIKVSPECQVRFPFMPGAFNMIKIHQDQVKSLPPGSMCLASSANCQYEMYSVGDRIICVQGHPEFTADIVSGLIQSCVRRGAIHISAAVPALRSLNELQVETGPLVQTLIQVLKHP